MTAPKTLAEAWQQREEEFAIAKPAPNQKAQSRRDFYAGAMAAILALRSGKDPAALISEVVEYGRTIGSAAERAA